MNILEAKKILEECFNIEFVEEAKNVLKYKTINDIILIFDLNDISNSIFNEDNMYLYNNNKIEIPILFNNIYNDKQLYNKTIKLDNDTNIKIGDPSLEYIFNVLKFANSGVKEDIYVNSKFIFDGINSDYFDEHTINNIIQYQCCFDRLYTISIYQNNIDSNSINDLVYSILFELSHNYDKNIYILYSLEEFYNESYYYHKTKNIFCLSNLLIKKYNKELILYYQNACSNNLYKYKFLSFYNILEYFMNENTIHKYIDKKSGLNINQNGSVYNIYKDILNNVKVNEETYLRLIFYIYIKDIDIDIIKSKFPYNSEPLIDYYKNNEVSFSKGCKVDLNNTNDMEKLFKNLANRIYKTRCSLVHSKRDEEPKYIIFKDDKSLIKEIYLIQFISEKIIENSVE